MYNNADCVASPDFKGYVFTLQPKYNYGVIVNTNGDFAIFALNPKKKLKRRKILKALLYLEEQEFISYEPESPFEEFEKQDIPLNMNHITFASRFFTVH